MEITHVDRRMLSAEDAVHIRADVGLSRETAADVGGDMESDILPVAARLVARPDACIALRASPSVQRDDEGACIVAIVGHELRHIGHAVEPERIARAHPGHVGLQHPYPRIAHLLDDVALQQGADPLLGMEVRLGPEADFHSFGVGIVGQPLQVLDIAVERFRLAVACSVAIIGEQPT